MKSKNAWIILWVVIRLPFLGLIGYLFRYQLLAIFEKTIGFTGRMDFFVFIISTFYARFLLYVFFAITLAAGYLLIQKIHVSLTTRYILWMISTFFIIFFSFYFIFKSPNSLPRTFIIFVFLAANTIPFEWIANKIKGLSSLFLVGIGISEVFFPQTYTAWLMSQISRLHHVRRWAWVGGILIVPLLWAFLLVPYDNQRIFTLTEKLYKNPAVEKFSPGIYNWIELNPENSLLYAVGRGTNFLLAFDLNHVDQRPKRSHKDIGKTQSFGFNPSQQEIYVYKADTRELLYMDATTLVVLRSVPIPDLAPGDVWIRWQYLNDSIIISSEADAEIGVPLYMLDRKSGDILAELSYPVYPTELTFHPSQLLMYFTSYKATYLAVWDMKDHVIKDQTEVPSRTDRITFSENTNEIWITAPLSGSILRYDADTLESKGFIKSSLGDRTLNIDTKRNLLLTGNFMSGRLTVIDLATEKKLASYYLGPWIRTIALDMENGIAYVSTVRGLFKVNYTAALK